MARLTLTGALGSLLVALLVAGSVLVFGRTLVGDTASMAVVLLVVVLFFLLGSYGNRSGGRRTHYW